MEIHLSQAAERFVEDQLRLGIHLTPEAVIDALVLERQTAAKNGLPSIETKAQKAAILALIKECEETSDHCDPTFSNRDHDRILYGDRT